MTPNGKIACFGEMMLRISPDPSGQWLREAKVPVYIGGAELNVASALARWEQPVKYITALPDHTVAQQMEDAVRNRGVELSPLRIPGSRVGIYYLTQGAELKSAGVTYDRDGSAFAGLQKGQIDWKAALADCGWFHFSAINPALNENVVGVCEEALSYASAAGLSISLDLNYRPRLWQYNKKPVDIMPPLAQQADLIMGNIWAAEQLLGIPAGLQSSEGVEKEQLAEAARQSAIKVLERYPKAKEVVYTFRLPATYFSTVMTRDQFIVSKTLPIQTVADRAGSGDCFMAALLYSKYNQLSLQQQADLAAAAAVLKMTEPGDITFQPISSVRQLAAL